MHLILQNRSRLCIYHLFLWSNFSFLHKSQLISMPNLLCLVLHSFCASLHHSLIMWLIVSSLSPYNLRLLFCCVLSFLALIWLVLKVSLFFSFVHVFSCKMLLVSHLKRPYSCFSSYFWFLVISVLLFLTLIVCQRHLWDIRLCASSLVFLFSGLFILVLLWSTSTMVSSI